MEKIHLMSPLKGDATKTFTWEDGVWKKTFSYKAGKYLTPYIVEVKDLKGFHELLRKIENHPCFMVHGRFKEGVDLNNPIVRRKKINPLEPDIKPTIEDRELTLFCLDIDEWPINKTQSANEAIECLIDELPAEFQESDYVYQFSASYGLTSNKLKCHLFFWLDKAAPNTQIQKWIKQYNKAKGWGKVIDPSILTCTQPVYTQRRICLENDDPIKEILGYIKKKGELEFEFTINELPQKSAEASPDRLPYDVAEGVKLILNSDDFHNEINKLAMSLLNKKVPEQTIIELIEGSMQSAKQQISDPQRLEDWQVRFDDIERSVRTAADIVGEPTIEDLRTWVKNSQRKEVRLGFAKKALHLDPVDMKLFVDSVEERLGVGVKNIKDTIKIAKKEAESLADIAKKEAKSRLRESKGVHEIVVTLSNTEEVCAKTSKILAESSNGDQVFKAASGLVKVGCSYPKTIRQVMKKHELGEDFPKMPIIQYFKTFSLGARIEKDIAFLNSSGKEIPCPTNVLKIVEEGLSEDFKPLSGIIEHPFVNTDFQIVQKNGYDDQTGLYATLHHKLKVTLMKPKDAYPYLAYEVFDEFPFASDLDRCVAVSALLTCVQRPVIAGDSGFPGFAVISPTQSSGKTTLCQLISYSVYNRAIPATNFTDDENELSKHLLAILREGHACVLFDNMQAGTEVRSNVLAKAMSSDTLSGRLLGDTKTIEVPSSVIWMFTGNSIYMQGDFATRIYPININANMENPDSRHFKRTDIGEWAIDNRKKIISAILSIILAAKKEVKMAGASRFPLWDRFVRQPLFKVAGIDINEAVNANKKNDSYLQAKINLLKLLEAKYAIGNEFPTSDMMQEAFGNDRNFDGVPSELGEVLIELLDKKARSSKSAGRLLSRLEGVVLGGLVLREGKIKTFPKKWRIDKV